MNVVIAATLSTAAVLVRETCSTIDAEALTALDVGESMAIVVYASDEPLMAMQTWTAARMRVGPTSDERRAVVQVAGCATSTPTVAVAFAQWQPGMDCGRRYVDAVMSLVDALDDDQKLSIKLIHLVRHLPAWHEARHCSIGSEQRRANIFWLCAAALTTACAFVRRRFAARPAGAKRH